MEVDVVSSSSGEIPRAYKPDPNLDGVALPPPPMTPLIPSNFLATLEAAFCSLLKPTKSSALRAFKFCGLHTYNRRE